MQRQGFGVRLLAGSLAVWFGMVTAAPAVLHDCPRALAAAAGQEQAPAAHHHHGAPAQPDTPSQLPGQCTCLGTCATAALAVLPSSPPIPVLTTSPSADGAIDGPAGIVPSTLPDHALPFATAPPFRSA